jgi:hypothetical protein
LPALLSDNPNYLWKFSLQSVESRIHDLKSLLLLVPNSPLNRIIKNKAPGCITISGMEKTPLPHL